MWKYIGFILLISVQGLTQAQECNYELLDMRADSIFQGIVHQVPLSKNVVEEYLDFLESDGKENRQLQKYSTKEFFSKLLHNSQELLVNKNLLKNKEAFQTFVNYCSEIFSPSPEVPNYIDQISVSMLLKEVNNKIKNYSIKMGEINSFLSQKNTKMETKNIQKNHLPTNPIENIDMARRQPVVTAHD